MALEGRMKSYDEETWRMVGEIVNVSIDESILNENGKVSLTKVAPIIYDWMSKDYLKVGEKVGNAYRDGVALKR